MKRWLGTWIVTSLIATVTVTAGVEVTLKSYQKARKGDKVVWVKAKKVIPGTTVKYVNRIHNKETETIYNLVLKNDIPEHMRYIPGSSRCKIPCKTYFSVDNGRHFAEPEKLMVRDKKSGKVRKAKPSEYTNIQWVIEKLEPGQKAMITYKAKLL